MNDLFRFIGDDSVRPKNTPKTEWPVTGEVYMLELTGRGGYMWVEISAPWKIPYKSWNAFLENWERV